jgi:hypothetical protein
MKFLAALALALIPTVAPAEEPAETSARAVRAAVESAFQEAAPPDARLEIVSLPPLVQDGVDAVVLVSWPEPMPRPGPCALPVSCRVGDRIVSRGLANVVIRVRRPVWIAGEKLARGATLDLTTLRREIHEFDREPPRLFRPDPGGRFLLLRDVPEGAALSVPDVRRLPGIETGQEVARTDPESGRSSCSSRV